ncbi:hypothetical protein H4R33_004199 [Dimargaris cristalligena]|uniref:DinB-like domain-containing protein n=1 Tax=Dimargaris cristalligena TaxID=215637 RepID=A0A4P9ZX39_9FUNG|nr:hypothetical protein H4R33_004199 [Dimargaris cristalligena]RKP38203.1 hypothetical protein BJ085DRAFT_39000 [Dimargaris cristalligena]|eukprot:RKP38203.1 hypothetical protein BJ085DRAFT_39000 [Dimargaris cristalligena]
MSIPVESAPSPSNRALLFTSAYLVLQQGSTLLRTLLLPRPDLMVRESQYIPGSTIGKHFRHLYDHFRLLLEALPANAAGATLPKEDLLPPSPPQVFYDKRDRMVPMEKDPKIAAELIEDLVEKLRKLENRTELPLEAPIQVQALIDGKSNYQLPLDSTLGRELWFCVHHAIHHYAMIKVVGAENDIQTAKDFGMAPSTIKYYDTLSS